MISANGAHTRNDTDEKEESDWRWEGNVLAARNEAKTDRSCRRAGR